MFAFLALAGDFGATASPAMVGNFSELAGGNLKIGLLAATIFPILLVVGLLVLNRKMKIAKILLQNVMITHLEILKILFSLI